jgi:hypothetical protein
VAPECAPQLTLSETFDVTVKDTYEGFADGTEEAKPITFHTYAFLALSGPREGFRLYRRRNDRLERCESEEGGGYMIVDDLPVRVNVSNDENFANLGPAESWSTKRRVQGQSWSSVPDDVAVGDTFQYMFKGTTVDWWNWGVVKIMRAQW